MQAAGSALIVNPNAQIKLVRDAGAIAAIEVRAPVKSERLKITTIERSAEPEIFGALLVQSAIGAMAARNFADGERARLAEMGLLVPPDRVSAPVWFSCDLTDPPCDLIPARARSPRDRAAPVRDLVASPTLRHLGHEGPPPDMRGRLKLPNPFRPDRSWLAIENVGIQTPCIYSFSSAADAQLGGLIPGQAPPAILRADVGQQLFDAGVIEARSQTEALRQTATRQVAAARTALHRDRYAVLPHIVPPLQLGAVRRYYRALIAEGLLPFGDREWPDRYFSGRDPIGYFYHHQLTGVVSAVVGERVKPSFSFFASYHPGAVLEPHRDREQCAYSLSILVDHSPEPEAASPWPLYLQPPGAAVAVPVSVGIGDAVLYYGREVLHYRERLTQADYCSFWFFFYVPESFDGPLD